MKIDLATPLNLGTCFRFPLQSKLSRAEIFKGGLLMLIPVVGWVLNMGHRIMMTHRMQRGQDAWPAWTDFGSLFRHGCIALFGMMQYHSPAVACAALARALDLPWLYVLACLLWILATIAVPGYMSHYCHNFDPREVFNPLRALRRVIEGGADYWRAWRIALAALALSFLGLLAFGIGFLFASVWFWQVAGFAFATVFTQTHKLDEPTT